jgi:tetratricopeptide (TPR) repeat protein
MKKRRKFIPNGLAGLISIGIAIAIALLFRAWYWGLLAFFGSIALLSQFARGDEWANNLSGASDGLSWMDEDDEEKKMSLEEYVRSNESEKGWLMLTKQYIAAGRPKDALLAAQNAISIAPKSVIGHYNLGAIYFAALCNSCDSKPTRIPHEFIDTVVTPEEKRRMFPHYDEEIPDCWKIMTLEELDCSYFTARQEAEKCFVMTLKGSKDATLISKVKDDLITLKMADGLYGEYGDKVL